MMVAISSHVVDDDDVDEPPENGHDATMRYDGAFCHRQLTLNSDHSCPVADSFIFDGHTRTHTHTLTISHLMHIERSCGRIHLTIDIYFVLAPMLHEHQIDKRNQSGR